MRRDVKRRAMRAVLITGSVCSVASLVGLVGISLMDFVPGPGVDALRLRLTLGATAFLLGWLGLSLWARTQMRLPTGAAAMPSWLRHVVVVAGAVYVLVVLALTVG